MRFISFKPIYQQRVWGGRGLSEKLGRKLPDDQPYGESWEIVDRDEAQSLIDGGQYDGMTLRDALKAHSLSIMGPTWDTKQAFPILVKWLDCKERLSLQVHPPAEIAGELGGEPKTENWYVADCDPGANLLVGLKNGTTREEFEQRLEDGTLEECVHRLAVQPDESMFVRSGRIHAIDGGNLILEIQQNSDTTYRVYDWGRVGLDGKPRQLHVEQSLQCINFEDFEPETIKPDNKAQQTLVESEIFNLVRYNLKKDESLSFNSFDQPRILSVAQGELRDAEDGFYIPRSANILLPFDTRFAFVAETDTTVLVTEGFTNQ
ncbi:MAG: type I phosphomannose isomerase catalytic subunit [Verrucomicrobiota bacterium]